MKIKLIIVLCFISVIFGITLNAPANDIFTVESALSGVNLTDWRVIQDSCGVKLERHINSSDYHHLADAKTDSTTGTNEGVSSAIYWLNDYIANLETHFSLDTLTVDSVHFKPDTLNTSIISVNGSYSDYKTGLASAIRDYNIHCSKDTTDASDVHITASVDTLITKIGNAKILLPDYSKLTLSATSSGVSSGATIFIDVSQDNITYVHLDSMAISTNTVTYKHITNLYKYTKFYCKYYTDGVYKLQIQTGGK